jgi:intracellular sulfur oxidation DsrE/DsrF family protein
MKRLVSMLVAMLVSGAAHADGPSKVVYHLNAGLEQASAALEYIRNHLEVEPKAQIVVVAHAAGVDFLMKGAKTPRGNPYQQAIEDLEFQGVKFRVCEITLRERKLRHDQFLPEARFVPSGVVEIARLQQSEGYAYLRP